MFKSSFQSIKINFGENFLQRRFRKKITRGPVI
jgi:hypothetical protein